MHWNGELESDRGQVSAQIALQLELQRSGRSAVLTFFPRRPPGFPLGTFDSPLGKIGILSDDLDGWYAPLNLDSSQQSAILRNGLVLSSGLYSLRWDTGDIIVFAESDGEPGGFVSREVLLLGQHGRLLVRDAQKPLVDSYLSKHSEPGWRWLRPTGIPTGWIVADDVCLTSTEEQRDERLNALQPYARASITLSGGLKLGRGLWLSSNEPALTIARDSSSPLQIVVDGKSIEVTQEAMVSIDLRRLDLSTGDHIITIDGSTKHFHTLSADDYLSLTSANGSPPLLGHPLERIEAEYLPLSTGAIRVPENAPARGFPWIIGADLAAFPVDLPQNLPQPLRLQSGARYYILLGNQPGMFEKVTDPHAPVYFHLGSPPDGFFTVTPSFPVSG
jgi:hypothetical protein